MRLPNRSRRLVGLGVVAGIVAAVACSDASPTATPRPAISKWAFDLDGDGRLSPAEKAAQKAAKDSLDSLKRADKEAYERARDEWKAYKDSVRKGTTRVEYLRCEPQARDEVRKTIGPKGGDIKIAGHKLVVPAGALSQATEIRAEVGGSVVDVRFAPHGLQFAVPVELTLSYKHCLFPEDGDPALQVAYAFNDGSNSDHSTDGRPAIAIQPSVQDTEHDLVVALTDHFSRYALARRSVYAVSYQVTRPPTGPAR